MEDAPEAKDRVTVLVDDEKGEKQLKNKKGKVSTVDPDLCIGCGVCVIKCPSKSMILELREALVDPPKDMNEWAQLFMEDVVAAVERETQGKEG